MKIEITILTAPIAVSVEQAAPVVAEIEGIGTLTVNNYYSEGGAGGYVLTDADKAEIAALARYDDTEIRAFIEAGDINVATYFGQEFGKLAGDVGTISQRSLRNESAIEGINTSISQFAEVGQAVTQHGRTIGEINATLGDIATILDAINGEEV